MTKCTIDFIYSGLDSKAKELYNMGVLSGLLIHHGYYTVPLPHDTNGADFIAIPLVPHDVKEELHIQLKSRPTTDPKYAKKNLHIAFPVRGEWFVMEYDAWHEFAEKKIVFVAKNGKWSNEVVRQEYLPELRDMNCFDFYSENANLNFEKSRRRRTWLVPEIK